MAKKHILITIRYSLLVQSFKTSWKIGNNSFEEYKKTLFEPSRMNVRQNIFKKVTLASLRKLEFSTPESVIFKVHILTSDELPFENMRYLEELVKPYKFIEIKKSSVEKASLSRDFKEYIDNHVKNGEVYASVRLDDDDALSLDWLKGITSCLESPRYFNHVVSLCSGYALKLKDDASFQKMAKWKWRFASAGMAYINQKQGNDISIYSCGNHGRTDDRRATLLDARKRSFIRVYNDYNDSGNKFPKGEELISNEASEILLDDFGIFLGKTSSSKKIYDFHNSTIGYDGKLKHVLKAKTAKASIQNLEIKLINGKHYFYLDDIGYIDIDQECNWKIVSDFKNLNYNIVFVSPVKFYIINKKGLYLSSSPLHHKVMYRWKPHLKTWEYFLAIDC